MAAQGLGGSCTAQRYCHSEARISGHVLGLHTPNSGRTSALRCTVRRRVSSYSQREGSVEAGGVRMWGRVLVVRGEVWDGSLGGCVWWWCSARRCSCSWKGESSWWWG